MRKIYNLTTKYAKKNIINKLKEEIIPMIYHFLILKTLHMAEGWNRILRCY